MKAFAELYANLDATTSSNAKLAALQAYFRQAPPDDAAWAVYFLSGGRPRQLVPTRLLRDMATQASGIEPWLFEESYQSVGDLGNRPRQAPTWPGGTHRRLAAGHHEHRDHWRHRSQPGPVPPPLRWQHPLQHHRRGSQARIRAVRRSRVRSSSREPPLPSVRPRTWEVLASSQ